VFKATVLARYQEKYPDFDPTLATEKLALDGHVVDHETLRVGYSKQVCGKSDASAANIVAGVSEGRTSVS
jgi:hypothetical protein